MPYPGETSGEMSLIPPSAANLPFDINAQVLSRGRTPVSGQVLQGDAQV